MDDRKARKRRIDRWAVLFCGVLWILIGAVTIRSAYYAYQRHTTVGRVDSPSRLGALMSPAHAFFAGDAALVFGIVLSIVALRSRRDDMKKFNPR